MSKVKTDKKLELIRTIRLQNQYNRQLFRSRENLLYSDDPIGRHGEIYGLEAAAYPVKDLSQVKSEPSKADASESILKGFRIRFAIAMLLFIAFVYCDVKHVSLLDQTSDTLYQIITESQQLPRLLDF
ncbi:MAG: hypothetical protein Q4D94_06990 [Bacillota bacterium]|nr:hypothetical protein [Bacillota bacterium]